MLSNCYIPKQVNFDNAKDENCSKREHFEIGVVRNAGGSSYLEIGCTKVICSVNGPFAPQRGLFSDIGVLEASVRFAPFTSKLGKDELLQTEKYLSSAVENALSTTIRLDLYPKTLIALNIVILQV